MVELSTWGSGHKPSAGTLTFVHTDLGAVTQNTWYTALNVTDAEIIGFGAEITVADETVEIRTTIDGTVINTTAGVAVAFAGNKFTAIPAYLRMTPGVPSLIQQAANANFDIGQGGVAGNNANNWCRGKSVLIEMRKTTAGGASHIFAIGAYWQY